MVCFRIVLQSQCISLRQARHARAWEDHGKTRADNPRATDEPTMPGARLIGSGDMYEHEWTLRRYRCGCYDRCRHHAGSCALSQSGRAIRSAEPNHHVNDEIDHDVRGNRCAMRARVRRTESPGEGLVPEAPSVFGPSMIGGSAQRLEHGDSRECRTEPRTTLPLCAAARELFRCAP